MLIWVALGLALLVGVYRQVKGSLRAAIAMAGLWLLVAGATFVVQTSEAYRQRFVRDYSNIEFVRSWLDQHDPDEEPRSPVLTINRRPRRRHRMSAFGR